MSLPPHAFAWPTPLPIAQAPMIGCVAPLVIAVGEAGGLGALACASFSPARIVEEAAKIRAATLAPFVLNFFCHTPAPPDAAVAARWRDRLARYYGEIGLDPAAVQPAGGRAPFDAAMAEAVETVRPAIVSFHFGLPEDRLLARVKATGAKVFSSATTLAEARWLEARGADAIIAQGVEAGGHRGMFLTSDVATQQGLFALLLQVADAVKVPVIAAGGIADGRGIAAALALGATAVQIGTGYLLTPEAGRPEIHRAALRAARDGAETALTNVLTGRAARGIVTRFMREMGPLAPDAPAFPTASAWLDPVRLAFEKAGRNDLSMLWAGEAVALTREEGAGETTRRLWVEAQDVMARLAMRG